MYFFAYEIELKNFKFKLRTSSKSNPNFCNCYLLLSFTRKNENAVLLMKENKIHISLPPIPINTHPFKLSDVYFFSCLYGEGVIIEVRILMVIQVHIEACKAKCDNSDNYK